MIDDLWLIGIGTGSPGHVTAEGMEAIRRAASILLPDKGEGKQALIAARRQIIAASGSTAQVVPFDYPVRDADAPYRDAVDDWHDEIARRWQDALDRADARGPVALLVWGDPALYDSTLRIARRLSPVPRLRVVPGITAIQALTAAHAIPLNDIGGDIHINTGRRLREGGWPGGQTTVVVMLDAGGAYEVLDPRGIHIWWGAYLGSADQILCEGPLDRVGAEIGQMRRQARARHGWIMDTYLLRMAADDDRAARHTPGGCDERAHRSGADCPNP